ncbi:MAG: hypothetical protein PWP22_1248 [Thermoanaerobacter sp.]|nr:hypothetical protein [Thermoanaerobacter sp.]
MFVVEMLNDVSFKKFACISLSLFLAFNGTIFLDYLDIDTPLVRQLFGFLFLSFIPGYTILRILQIHRIDKVEALLYAVGLSIFYIMSVGISMNFLLPLLGIKAPITLKFILVTIDATYLLFFIWSYFKGGNYGKSNNTTGIKLKDVVNLQILALLLLPLLAMLGAYSMNEYANSVTLFLVGCLFASLLLQKNSKPVFTIWIISLSLLYVYWMFSPYIWGSDIYMEAYFSKLTLDNGYWNTSIGRELNSLPLLTLAIPVFSKLLGIEVTHIFKLVIPFYISLLPVSLYLLYRYYFMNDKMPILATLLFVSDVYYKVDITAVRQVIAELYIVLLIITIYKKYTNKVLTIFFIWGIIFSHYGSALLFFLVLVAVFVLAMVIKPDDAITHELIKKIVLLYTVAIISWYLYIANSSLIYIYRSIINTIIVAFSGVLPSKTALDIVPHSMGFLTWLYKIVYLIIQVLIVIGFLYYLYEKRRKLDIFDYFSIAGIGILGSIVIIPYFGMVMDVWRTYHFSLLFVSCYFPIGILAIQKGIIKFVHVEMSQKNMRRIIAIFLVVFLLFNSGVIYSIFHYSPKEIPTSWTWMKKSQDRWVFYMRFRLSEDATISGKWMSKYVSTRVPIITDTPSSSPLLLSARISNPIVLKAPCDARQGEIVFFGNSVIFSKYYILKGTGLPGLLPYPTYCILVNHIIYTNNGSMVLKVWRG